MHKGLLTAMGLGSILSSTTLAAPIERELNQAREALTDLECQPFNFDSIASLEDWSKPGVLTPENMKGQVVLIAMIDGSNPASIMTLSGLKRMNRDFGKNGALVVALNPDTGFEKIQARVSAGKVAVPVARDAGAVFANAMHTDDYPDYYLIDRAGNLRFADISNKSLKEAMTLLTSETPESAATNAQRQQSGLEPELAQPETETDPSSPNTNAPKTDQNASLSWPPHTGSSTIGATKDSQGTSYTIDFGENPDWMSELRPDIEGKVVILDFWTTSASTSLRIGRKLNDMYEEHEGKIEIIGINSRDAKDKAIRKLSRFPRSYPQLSELEHKAIESHFEITTMPHAVIISTDGIVRWQGFAVNSIFDEALNTILEVDPGVQD